MQRGCGRIRVRTYITLFAFLFFVLSLLCLWLELWDLLGNAYFDLQREKGSQAF
jgi:hypothetical protein